jgi:hypothetical protein
LGAQIEGPTGKPLLSLIGAQQPVLQSAPVAQRHE